jgi:phosphate starvation-inducible PhoH-like protein
MSKKSKVESLQEKQERQAKPFGVSSDHTISNITLSQKQKYLLEIIDEKDITIVTGPAGTSKTFIDCYYAVTALRDGLFDKVIFSKPVQEAGEKRGFLPGDINSKIDPHYESFKRSMGKMLKKSIFEKMLREGAIEFRPLAYMRGATFDRTLMILDEAQNADIRQIMLFTTRMGKESKVIISGDIHQYDIDAFHVALPFFVNMVNDIEGVGIFEFAQEDIVRNKILIEITTRYEKLKAENKLPRNKYA